MTSHQNHFNLEWVILCCATTANYGTVPYSLIFTPITALLLAVLEANTEPFRNGLVEKGNQLTDKEQTRNAPSSYLLLPQNLFSELLCTLPAFEHEILNYLAQYFQRYELTNYFQNFPIMKNVWSAILINFYFCRHGSKRFDVHFRRIRPVYFAWKDGDDAA